MCDETDDCIRQRAYELWESEERPHGEDIRHWMLAEDEFHSRSAEEGSSTGNSDVGVLPNVKIMTREPRTADSIREITKQ